MKNWMNFLLCVLLAAGIWLLHNMSQTYSEVMSVPVVVVSDIPGRASSSNNAAVVAARCNTTGWRHFAAGIRYSGSKVEKVFISSKDLVYEQGNFYSLSPNALARYASNIFGSGVQLESVVSTGVQWRFSEENYKVVPVQTVRTMEFRMQYTSIGEMTFSPDSVLVYGDPDRLSEIERVFTEPIRLKDVHNSINGVVKLVGIAGVRLGTDEVSYSMDVTRYVDITRSVKILSRHVPAGSKFIVVPTTANAVFRCEFPYVSDDLNSVEFYVDYYDFESSISGKCIVRNTELPKGVIECRLDTEVCECMESL